MSSIEVNTTDRPEWLLWRHAGIGSSDVPAIMGVSRFKTRNQLLLEKSTGYGGEDSSNSFIKNKGNQIEKHVREFLEKDRNQSLQPFSCTHPTFTFMRASLDGGTADREIITEIKLLSTQNPAKINTQTDGYIKWLSVKEKGIVPKDYYPQIQHQLFVTGAKMCLFAGYKEIKGEYFANNSKLAVVEVLPDKEYIKRMAEEEFKFWFEVEQLRKDTKYVDELE